jgi:VWFA-related protein
VRFTWTVGVLVVAIFVSRPASGDAPRPEVQISRFRTGVDVVSLNVTVTDGLRRYISDLGRNDFQIFEDGRKQELTFFQKTGLPLALVFLLDTSASMQASLPVAQEAAIGFARELGPADLASVIDFDTTAHILQGFTSDRSAIERAIRSTEANGRPSTPHDRRQSACAAAIARWTIDTLPSDWSSIRNRWEAFHAARTFIAWQDSICIGGSPMVM